MCIGNHCFVEFLQKLEYTSSEDEFLDYDDAKENYVNLNKRKPKMGKLSNRTPVKQERRNKRRSYPDAEVSSSTYELLFIQLYMEWGSLLKEGTNFLQIHSQKWLSIR